MGSCLDYVVVVIVVLVWVSGCISGVFRVWVGLLLTSWVDFCVYILFWFGSLMWLC